MKNRSHKPWVDKDKEQLADRINALPEGSKERKELSDRALAGLLAEEILSLPAFRELEEKKSLVAKKKRRRRGDRV